MIQPSTERSGSFSGPLLHNIQACNTSSSFESFIQPHLPYLKWLARKYLDDSEFYTADDLVGDTIYKAYRAWSVSSKVEQPLNWLCTILVNTFKNHVQRSVTLRAKLGALDLRDEHRWVLGAQISDYDDAECDSSQSFAMIAIKICRELSAL